MRVHWTVDTAGRRRRNACVAAGLTTLTPVDQPVHLADPLDLDRVTTALAPLPVATVNGESPGHAGHRDSPRVDEVGAQHARRGIDDLARIVEFERADARER